MTTIVPKNAIILLAASTVLYSSPAWGLSIDKGVFDQFTDAFDVGLFQGVLVDSELSIESVGDTGGTQGVNVIVDYHYDGEVIQKTIVSDDLLLTLSNGDDVVQGVNVYRGGSADAISQTAIIEGELRMQSIYNDDSVQGINVITAD